MNMLDKKDKSLAPSPNGAVPVDKIERYKWARPNSPGEFRRIDKQTLNLDDRYQRSAVSGEAVARIARDWDWTLFGVLKVAERGDRTLWVFDGGHRLRASFYRSDIAVLPCMVFDLAEFADEARSFLAGARMTSRIRNTDVFRAATTAEEPWAVKTAAILKDLGLTVTNWANKPGDIRCVSAVQVAVQADESLARRCLETCVIMAGESPVNAAAFRGLFALCRRFPDRDILDEYQSTLSLLTQAEIDAVIRKKRAETGLSGDGISARAILDLLNKGKRSRKLAW